MTARARNGTRLISHVLLRSLSSLTGFATNLFASISNSLAMIRLGRANAANFSRNLPNRFTVKPAYFNLTGFGVGFKNNTSRWFYLYRMRITHMQDKGFAFHLSAVPHTFHFQGNYETRTHTMDHIRNDSTGGAMQS